MKLGGLFARTRVDTEDLERAEFPERCYDLNLCIQFCSDRSFHG